MIIDVKSFGRYVEVTLAHNNSAIGSGLLDEEEARELMEVFKYAIEDLQDFLDSRKVK